MPSTHYVGKAGQFAVMAELALRGYNVAIPEVDIGDDVFVLNDSTGMLTRVQVKTANGSKQDRSQAYRCQFSVKIAHVRNAANAGIHYVLVGRCGRRWRFLVLSREVLKHLMENGLGTGQEKNHMISILFFSDGTAKSSTRPNAIDLSQYVGSWAAWPKI